MPTCKSWLIAQTVVVLLIAANQTDAQQTSSQADQLFRKGDFQAAASEYKKVVESEPDNMDAALRLAEIALLNNKLDQAEQQLSASLKKNPKSKKANSLAAQCAYRKNDFQKAGLHFEAIGMEAKAKKLKSFKDVKPYQLLAEQPSETSIPFVVTDPLPVIKLRVNDSEEIMAIIDTGGGELILDPEFAESVGVEKFGKQESQFAGGKTTSIEHAKVDRVQLGKLTLHNVPVNLLPTRRFAAAAGGNKIDAVVGTILLKQFYFAIDYRTRALKLSTKKTILPGDSTEKASIPFHLAGDHLIIADGTVNKSDPMKFFVDTGLAGQAFTCPKSTLDIAGIVPAGPKFKGMGGGGPIEVQMFSIDALGMGEIQKKGLTGLAGPFPEDLEYARGFRIGGLVSHAFFRDMTLAVDFDSMTITLSR